MMHTQKGAPLGDCGVANGSKQVAATDRSAVRVYLKS
jgi:hypothetical protein